MDNLSAYDFAGFIAVIVVVCGFVQLVKFIARHNGPCDREHDRMARQGYTEDEIKARHAVREQRQRDEQNWAYPQYGMNRTWTREKEGEACPKEFERRLALGQTPAQIRTETTSRNAAIHAYGAPVHVSDGQYRHGHHEAGNGELHQLPVSGHVGQLPDRRGSMFHGDEYKDLNWVDEGDLPEVARTSHRHDQGQLPSHTNRELPAGEQYPQLPAGEDHPGIEVTIIEHSWSLFHRDR